MAKQVETLQIGAGPSKFDLMLALFDPGGERSVSFRVDSSVSFASEWVSVRIFSAWRVDSDATSWALQGTINRGKGVEKIHIFYSTESCKGQMEFREGIMRPILDIPSDLDPRKKAALWIVFQKIIGRYQNSHALSLDQEIFRLFEKAKCVYRAENDQVLTAAVKNI